MTDSPTNPAPIAWRAVTYGTPVTGANGAALGVVAEMLGSDAEDIFHGVRVRLAGEKRDVLLSSDLVTGLTAAAVQTSLSPVDAEALPTYADEATYHLASVGWLRKHLGWSKDSGKDEEPG
ncbi:MAG TPA: hypothetical protein VKR24_10520 [Candidatus Limnocylindrales bacterium]|nr:hypothetical protein [Candidatus Limnocylindrales bacterium]